MPARERLNYRSFVSLLTTFSFITAAVSGLVLYVSPQGRVAFWQNWTMLGLGKIEWNSLHTLGSFLFAATSLFHFWFNWKAFVGYLRNRLETTLGHRRELAAATMVAIFVMASAIYGLPPLNAVVSFGDRVKGSWAKGGGNEPPFPHAELMTLEGLTMRLGIDTGAALSALEQHHIAVKSPEETLISIARENRVAPSDLFAQIRHFKAREDYGQDVLEVLEVSSLSSLRERAIAATAPRQAHAADTTAETTPEIKRYTDYSVVIKFDGTGIGVKTLEQICREFEIPMETAQQKLARRNLAVSPTELLKEAARRNGVMPIEILQAVIVGEPARK